MINTKSSPEHFLYTFEEQMQVNILTEQLKNRLCRFSLKFEIYHVQLRAKF